VTQVWFKFNNLPKPLSFFIYIVADCDDESDEKECSIVTCVGNDFKCDGNKCIPDYKLCNNVTDCKDGTDEKWCDCGPLFQCKTNSKKCLPLSARCDGILRII
jgi:low density lipoprotein-related protein 2